MKGTCEYCGKTFTLSTPRQVTCSEKCRIERKRVRDRLRQRKIRDTEPKYCLYCGKLLPETAHLNARTCSKECRDAQHRRTSRISTYRTALDKKGIPYTEDTIEEIFARECGIQLMRRKEFRSVEEKRIDKKLDREFTDELRRHREFRDSIKPETIAKDEAQARKLGVSYGEYIAFYKEKPKDDRRRKSKS